MKHSYLLIFITIFGGSAFGQAPVDCNNGLSPICGNSGITFTAQSGVIDANITNPGNNYGCLNFTPNPTWYYLGISQSGDIYFDLSAPSDIDFIVYGPFTDSLSAINGCNDYGNGGVGGNIVDCSYSSDNNETPEILGAQAGEVYVLLITNYANQVQDVTFQENGNSTGSTDCNIVSIPPCESSPGTFIYEKNNQVATAPLFLCPGDQFSIISNGDYILPNDTIPQPQGDGIYSAQLMWLVYNAPPSSNDPNNDPAYTHLIIPTEDLNDVNNSSSQIIQDFGCGTYYFVPVAGDDGIGGNNNTANLVDDNGTLNWDKNNNNCYQLGTPIEVTYSCEIATTASKVCNYPTVENGIDVSIAGGNGDYTLVNFGNGNIDTNEVSNPGNVLIEDLENGESWNVKISDGKGCTTIANGTFSGPDFTSIDMTPAPDCPAASTGNIDVVVDGTSGQGSPYTIKLNGNTTNGTTASYSDLSGTLVTIFVEDAAGCINDTAVTIGSQGHFIDINITSHQNEQCYGNEDGAVTIDATPTPSGNVTSVVWLDPNGNQVGNNAPTHLSENSMSPGVWTVCVTDDVGCDVCTDIEITSPQELDIFLSNKNDPSCYGYSDASIQTNYIGGTSPVNYSWSHDVSNTSSLANTINAGQYITYVTDGNGCVDSLVTEIINPDSLYVTYTVKNIDCFGDSTGSIIITDVFGNFGNEYYVWELSGQATTPSSSTNLAENLPAGEYLLTITDSNGCSNEYKWALTQNSPLEAEIQIYPAYCRLEANQNGNGVLTAKGTGGKAGYDYLWTEFASGESTVNSTWGARNPGNYSIEITDAAGCTYIEHVVLDSVNPIADFTVLSSDLNSELEGTEPVKVSFINNSEYFSNPQNQNADTSFFWNLDTTNNKKWILSQDFYYEPDTIYNGENIFTTCLVAKNKNDCVDTSCKAIVVHELPIITVPNVFTPNGDNKNDIFQFEQLSQGVKSFNAIILDRWGREIYKISNIDDGWDGTTKSGKPSVAGVYFVKYEVEFTNGEIRSGQGSVTLIRGE